MAPASRSGTGVNLPGDTGVDRSYDFTYDESDRLITVTDPSRATYTYTYSDNGQLLTVSDPLSRSATLWYDEDRVVSYRDGVGSTTTFRYDTGRALVTDPLNNSSTFVLNGQGRFAQTINALGDVTTLT